jgi:glyoxylase-like metal-dependent hydrolase (beta-lactamase superfamily II)
LADKKFEVRDVSWNPGGTSYLLITKESAFLCDTGFAFSAADTVAKIEAALRDAAAADGMRADGAENITGAARTDGARADGAENVTGAARADGMRAHGARADGAENIAAGDTPPIARRKLDYILLTHSHFDHAGGTPAVARAFPEAKIVASSYAAKVFTRPGARGAIRDMDVASARFFGREPTGDTTAELRVDIEVNDGDVVRTADEVVRVYDTHGHTNCSVSYYFENESLLVTSESSGFKFGDTIWPAFLTSCRDSLESIALLERLAPEHLLLPHAGLISGDEAKAYPAAVRAETEQKADFVMSRHNAGMSDDEIADEFITAYFDGAIKDTGMQPLESFEANAHELIPRLIAEQKQQP